MYLLIIIFGYFVSHPPGDPSFVLTRPYPRTVFVKSEPFRFSCSFKGRGSFDVHILRGNRFQRALPTTKSLRNGMVLVTATIKKDEALYRHAGNYTCVATSGIGAMSTVGETFEVTVKGKAATNSLTLDLLELFKLLSIMRGSFQFHKLPFLADQPPVFLSRRCPVTKESRP